MQDGRSGKDPKVKATSVIWAMATAMLGICIPLVAITNSGILLPLVVILGAAGATAAIWLAPASDRPRQLETQKISGLVEGLATRVENLETICSSVEFDMQQRLINSREIAQEIATDLNSTNSK